jgi:hypothetical protein
LDGYKQTAERLKTELAEQQRLTEQLKEQLATANEQLTISLEASRGVQIALTSLNDSTAGWSNYLESWAAEARAADNRVVLGTIGGAAVGAGIIGIIWTITSLITQR